MAYLLSEISIGLLLMTTVGFIVGWTLRGIQERINKQNIED